MSDKTEQPTQRKLEKARKEGKFPISREFVSASQFLVFVWLIGSYGPVWFRTSSVNFRLALTAGFRGDLTPIAVQQLAWNLARGNLFALLFAGVALTVTILVAQIFTTNLGISLAKLSPDFSRLNPLGAAAATSAAESPAIRAGTRSAAGVRVRRLRDRTREPPRLLDALAFQHAGRRTEHRTLTHGAVMASRDAVHGVRIGRSVPPTKEACQRI